jgi:hypothetical protein
MLSTEQLQIDPNISLPEWITVTEIYYKNNPATIVGLKFNVEVKIKADINYNSRRDGIVIIRQKETNNSISIPFYQDTTPTPESRIGFNYDNSFETQISLSYPSSAQSLEMNVLSTYNKEENHPFTYSAPDWITATINNQYNKISINIAQNTTEESRNGTITLKQQNSNLTCTFKFIQLQ